MPIYCKYRLDITGDFGKQYIIKTMIVIIKKAVILDGLLVILMLKTFKYF